MLDAPWLLVDILRGIKGAVCSNPSSPDVTVIETGRRVLLHRISIRAVKGTLTIRVIVPKERVIHNAAAAIKGGVNPYRAASVSIRPGNVNTRLAVIVANHIPHSPGVRVAC